MLKGFMLRTLPWTSSKLLCRSMRNFDNRSVQFLVFGALLIMRLSQINFLPFTSECIEILSHGIILLGIMNGRFNCKELSGIVFARLGFTSSVPNLQCRRIKKEILPDVNDHLINQPRHDLVVFGLQRLEFWIGEIRACRGARKKVLLLTADVH